MKAVIIGAGRIGCGLAADLLHRSGHEIVVVGRGAALAALRRTRACRVRLTDSRGATERLVEIAEAVRISDVDLVAKHIASADVVCTAVGGDRLNQIADALAAGLALAKHPIDVLAFENRTDAGSALRLAMIERLGEAAALRHGYSGSVIARAVSERVLPKHYDDHLLVIGDRPDEVHVEATALTGAFAAIRGLVGVDEFRPYYLRKLFRFSTGHATAAYIGSLKGHRTVHEAVADPEVAAIVLGAMEEGRRGLAARYGTEVAGSHSDLHLILDRFGNAALGDTVERVGRDVARKLSRDERLIGAARLAHRAGLGTTNIVFAVAAALSWPEVGQASADDAAARARVAEITGQRPTHELVGRIADAWAELAADRHYPFHIRESKVA